MNRERILAEVSGNNDWIAGTPHGGRADTACDREVDIFSRLHPEKAAQARQIIAAAGGLAHIGDLVRQYCGPEYELIKIIGSPGVTGIAFMVCHQPPHNRAVGTHNHRMVFKFSDIDVDISRNHTSWDPANWNEPQLQTEFAARYLAPSVYATGIYPSFSNDLHVIRWIAMSPIEGTLNELLSTNLTDNEMMMVEQEMTFIFENLNAARFTHGDLHCSNVGYIRRNGNIYLIPIDCGRSSTQVFIPNYDFVYHLERNRSVLSRHNNPNMARLTEFIVRRFGSGLSLSTHQECNHELSLLRMNYLSTLKTRNILVRDAGIWTRAPIGMGRIVSLPSGPMAPILPPPTLSVSLPQVQQSANRQFEDEFDGLPPLPVASKTKKPAILPTAQQQFDEDEFKGLLPLEDEFRGFLPLDELAAQPAAPRGPLMPAQFDEDEFERFLPLEELAPQPAAPRGPVNQLPDQNLWRPQDALPPLFDLDHDRPDLHRTEPQPKRVRSNDPCLAANNLQGRVVRFFVNLENQNYTVNLPSNVIDYNSHESLCSQFYKYLNIPAFNDTYDEDLFQRKFDVKVTPTTISIYYLAGELDMLNNAVMIPIEQLRQRQQRASVP